MYDDIKQYVAETPDISMILRTKEEAGITHTDAFIQNR